MLKSHLAATIGMALTLTVLAAPQIAVAEPADRQLDGAGSAPVEVHYVNTVAPRGHGESLTEFTEGWVADEAQILEVGDSFKIEYLDASSIVYAPAANCTEQLTAYQPGLRSGSVYTEFRVSRSAGCTGTVAWEGAIVRLNALGGWTRVKSANRSIGVGQTAIWSASKVCTGSGSVHYASLVRRANLNGTQTQSQGVNLNCTT